MAKERIDRTDRIPAQRQIRMGASFGGENIFLSDQVGSVNINSMSSKAIDNDFRISVNYNDSQIRRGFIRFSTPIEIDRNNNNQAAVFQGGFFILVTALYHFNGVSLAQSLQGEPIITAFDLADIDWSNQDDLTLTEDPFTSWTFSLFSSVGTSSIVTVKSHLGIRQRTSILNPIDMTIFGYRFKWSDETIRSPANPEDLAPAEQYDFFPATADQRPDMFYLIREFFSGDILPKLT